MRNREHELLRLGWLKTERGHIRKEGFRYLLADKIGTIWINFATWAPRKFVCFPLAVNSSRGILDNWVATDAQLVMEVK